jgi:superfamily II DNA or RNA helicase
MKIVISDKLLLQDVPQNLIAELKDRLSFVNPKYLELQKHGYWTGETPRMLRFYETGNGSLIIPRGFIRQLLSLCRRFNVNYQISDSRRVLDNVKFAFNGQLRPFQEVACKDILSHDFGVLSAPTGSGKTVIALYLISQRKQPALIIVHTKELLNQWIDRIETFLGIQANEVGIIGNGKKQIGEKITVGLVQSVYKCASEIAPYIGFLIVDEGHRTPSRTFTEAVTAFCSKYMLGLSATPWRRDGLSKLIYWHLGDVVHEIKKEDLIQTGDILQAEVITRETIFNTVLDPSEEYSKMLSELTQDPERNLLIVQDVVKEASNGGGTCLVLSDRKAHCETLKGLLRGHGIRSELLTGDINGKEREKIVDRLNEGLIKVLIATGQLIGEGFDCKGLSTLFLTTPIKFNGRVIQYLGRVLRPAPGKGKAKVYDYVDIKVGVLAASAKSRKKVYGY